MARSGHWFAGRPPVVVVNPDDDVTPEAFFAWLDEIESDEPLDLPVTAAETLAAGEA